MAQRKNRKSGRYTKSSRRRSKPKTNLTNLAVSGLVANSITQGLFKSNLIDFFTGRRDGVYRAGSDGGDRLTLPELIGWGSIKTGGNYGANPQSGYGSLTETLETNFKENWGQIAMGVIFIPVAANIIQKVIRKPVILPANRLLKSVGLKDYRV
jgi:hypothetical protein